MKVFRCNISTYQSTKYQQQERQLVENLGFTYLTPQQISTTEQPDIVITNSNTRLENFPFALEKIKLLIHPNSGYDNLPPEVVMQIGGPVILGNSIRAAAVTNYILSCLFHALHSPPFTYQWDSLRQWQRKDPSSIKLLIIGHGHIGKLLHQSLNPLYPQISIYDPYQSNKQWHHLPKLSTIDVVLLSPNLSATSYQMINKSFLQQLKSDVILINGARGKLINEDHLYSFLQLHPRAKIYLDVFQQEPADLSRWKKFSNIYLSSHVAGVFQGLDTKILQFIQEILLNFTQLSEPEFNLKYHQLYLQEKLKQIPAYQ